MSDLIENHNERFFGLYAFSKDLIINGHAKETYSQYRALTDTVTALETMQVIDRLLLDGLPFEQIKSNIGKLLNVFFASLKNKDWDQPGEGHFLYYLMRENQEVIKIIHELKQGIKALGKSEKPDYSSLISCLEQLKVYELHCIKKENILFPYIEKTVPQYRCLQLMWSFHDDYRRLLKSLFDMLAKDVVDNKLLYKTLGDLFFVLLPIIFREENILFPVVCRAIPLEAWDEMLQQSSELGWCYIETPEYKTKATNLAENSTEGWIDLNTGQLSVRQIILMMEHLPVDITFVDENDEVRYFSGVKYRIFPRSKAIIGRKVQNCHPKESVHVVNQIVDAFRNGEKDHADFWINMRGRFIHIRYFALRDESGIYKGTIEVSQDVTEIRALEGEQRLLSWENK